MTTSPGLETISKFFRLFHWLNIFQGCKHSFVSFEGRLDQTNIMYKRVYCRACIGLVLDKEFKKQTQITLTVDFCRNEITASVSEGHPPSVIWSDRPSTFCVCQAFERHKTLSLIGRLGADVRVSAPASRTLLPLLYERPNPATQTAHQHDWITMIYLI